MKERSAAAFCRDIGQHQAGLAKIGLIPPDMPRTWQRLATVGALDVWPLAQISSSQILGIRALPGVEARERPVVIVDLTLCEQMMLAASSATLVPIWTTLKQVHGSSSDWLAWGSKVRSSEVAELHEWLGGQDGLAPLEAMLGCEDLRRALCSDLEGMLWSEALPNALSIAAPDDPRGSFQQTIDDLARKGWGETALEAVTFGHWSEPGVLLTAWHARPHNQQDRLPYLKAAAGKAAGHDAAWLDRIGLPDDLGTAARENGAPTLIACKLVELATSLQNDDPAMAAVLAHSAAKANYNGRAHLDAIRPLLDNDDPEAAWNAAMTAAFWIFQRRGSVPGDLMMMICKLAEEVDQEHLWPVVAEQVRAMGAEL